MMTLLLLGLIAAAASAPASAHEPDVEQQVPYRCDDLVVIGRLKNLGYAHVAIEDDLLGHGYITARVTVRRVVHGRVESRVVPVRYFAHSYFRSDRDFLLVIDPGAPEGSVVRSARLFHARNRPRIAPACG